MGKYFAKMVVGGFFLIPSMCLTGFLLDLKEIPMWLILGWATFWALLIEIVCAVCEAKQKQAERDHADWLELEKHRLTVMHQAGQSGQEERSHDLTRLPPEMLKAFQKPGNGYFEAAPDAERVTSAPR
jgi:hypothetical protein